MSIIVPAGNKKINWSSKEEMLVKTASTEIPEVKEEVNALYEAAKTFVAASECCKECKKPKNFCECKKEESKEEKKDEVKKEAGCIDGKPVENKPVENKPAEVSDKSVAKDDSAAILEVETPAGEKVEECAKEKIEVAVDKLEEVVVDLKDAVQKTDVAEEAEVEIEIEDDKAPSIPGEEVSNSEIIVESTPACACANTKKEVVMDKAASTEEEFCRFAKLSPANKKKLGDYWTNMLGFPKDYVSLMVKDYEK